MKSSHLGGGSSRPASAAGTSAAAAPAQSSRRVAADALNALRGRGAAQRFEVTVVPFFCGDLPPGLTGRLVLTLQRGAKSASTEPAPVNPHTRAVMWRQQLSQATTLYRDASAAATAASAGAGGGGGGGDGNGGGRGNPPPPPPLLLLPKEFALKLQEEPRAAPGAAAPPPRRTVAKVLVDVSRYCRGAETDPPPQEVFFQLQ